MTENNCSLTQKGAISASWIRCKNQHQMVRNAARPANMRLQHSEIAPRLESLLELTAGNRRLFRHLAINSASAGHCTVVTDASGILVMLDNGDGRANPEDWNGIGLGTCWDERIAGTNGVALAMLEGQQVTVRGVDHYLTRLSQFTCSAAPLLDADNQMIGVLSLAAIDRGNTVDYLFAKQMLDATAGQLQRNLFERKFANAEIYRVAQTEQEYLLGGNELVAVDESGIVLGSTKRAHTLFGFANHDDITGKSIELLAGRSIETLRIPQRVVGISNNHVVSFQLQTRQLEKTTGDSPARHVRAKCTTSWKQPHQPHAVAPTLSELAESGKTMASSCKRAESFFHRGLPFLIEGPSGSGKSAIINALLNSVEPGDQSIVKIDCATLRESNDDQFYMTTLFEQARAIGSWGYGGEKPSTLIFDNIDELPAYAQAGLRNLLSDMESRDTIPPADTTLRVIATCKPSLRNMVDKKSFRDDLYYLLTNTIICTPKLKELNHRGVLFSTLARRIAGHDIEITSEAFKALENYNWPGNVRQLRSVLRQALMEGNGQRISLADLASTAVCNFSLSTKTMDATTQTPLNVVYDEKTRLLDSLHSADWNISAAARMLGMARATIHRKMKHHGITRPGKSVVRTA